MSRPDNKRYERQVMLTMVVYMLVLFAVGPLMNRVASVALKAVLAVLPALPVVYIIALMWRRIRDSDELEQRMHLVALGAAVAVVSATSVVAGFLAGSGVLRMGGEALIWVFPLLMASYGIARNRVARRYGMDATCVAESSRWLPWYFAGMALAMAIGAVYFALQHNGHRVESFLIAATVFAAIGVWVGWRRARARRQLREDQR